MRAFLLLLFALSITSAGVQAGTTPPAQKLPPGMTPALMQMMMKPGPAHAAGLPADVKPLSGCIPSMGYHYARNGDMPFGPIYGWYNGKPIFTEVMIDQKLFASGKSWDETLKPLPGYHIDHVDVWFEPHGHPGYSIPHYDVHAWYVSHAAHMKFCGNTSGKKPNFL